MRNEGVREWLFSIRYFDDAKLLAASEFARRAGIWDRSIQAADRTVRRLDELQPADLAGWFP